jgi:hypothetical protein
LYPGSEIVIGMHYYWSITIVIGVSLLTHAFAALDAEFVKKAELTYQKLLPCLKNRAGLNMENMDKIKFPADAEEHYKDLLEKTLPYRNHKPHSWAGFSGPWIENIFISEYADKPLTTFSGMIPLFIQWTDIHVNMFAGANASVPPWGEMPDRINKLLRDDVIYVMITQDDEGLTARLANLKPNILSLSAGGFGHIPIPLIKGEIEYVTPDKFSHDVSFLGSLHPRLARSG